MRFPNFKQLPIGWTGWTIHTITALTAKNTMFYLRDRWPATSMELTVRAVLDSLILSYAT